MKLLVVADFPNIADRPLAEAALDHFREAVLPSLRYGLTLYQASKFACNSDIGRRGCTPSCAGWGWVDGTIERCNECDRFPDDVIAARHVLRCVDCTATLGAIVVHAQLGI